MFFQALSYCTCENVFFDKGPSELMAQRPQGDRRARSLKVIRIDIAEAFLEILEHLSGGHFETVMTVMSLAFTNLRRRLAKREKWET